jgi:hypothetical protein
MEACYLMRLPGSAEGVIRELERFIAEKDWALDDEADWGVREVLTWLKDVPRDLLYRIATASNSSAASSAVEGLAAQGDRHVLSLLIELHRNKSDSLKTHIFEVIEGLASRLGVVIQEHAGELQVQEP